MTNILSIFKDYSVWFLCLLSVYISIVTASNNQSNVHQSSSLEERVNILEKLVIKQNQQHDKDKINIQRLENLLEVSYTKYEEEIQKIRNKLQECKIKLDDDIKEQNPIQMDFWKSTESNDDSTSTTDIHDVNARSDDLSPLATQMAALNLHVTQLDASLQSMQNQLTQRDASIQDGRTSTFVRWGHSQCPGRSE